MQIARNSLDTAQGSSDCFTGTVYIDTIAGPPAPARAGAALVRFTRALAPRGTPGENHWHGAAPTRFMTHIAIQEADENGSPVTWGEHVPDEQYNIPPPA